MTEELKEQIHERIYNLKVPTLGFSKQDLFNIAMEYAEPREKRIEELEYQLTHRNCLDCSNHSSKLRMRNLDLEKENAELKEKYVKNITDCDICDTYCNSELTKAKEIIKKLKALYFSPVVTKDDVKRQDEILAEAEQFLKDETEQEEPYYVIMNMNCQYEICRMCPKSGLFKGTYEECEKWIKEKLSEVEK